MSRPELTGVPGVAESAISSALLDGLPANLAPAPWTVRGSAVVWFARAGSAADDALPPALRADHRAAAVVGGMVRYSDTPVGPYNEVFGLVAARRGLRQASTVSFMSVDSEASLVGGRTNWAMPKTLGAFDGELGDRKSLVAVGADEVSWRVSVTARSLGPAFPVRRRSVVTQEFPDGRLGRSQLAARARMRLAVVTADVSSDGTLPSWLRPGRRLGALIDSVTFTFGEPRFD